MVIQDNFLKIFYLVSFLLFDKWNFRRNYLQLYHHKFEKQVHKSICEWFFFAYERNQDIIEN